MGALELLKINVNISCIPGLRADKLFRLQFVSLDPADEVPRVIGYTTGRF